MKNLFNLMRLFLSIIFIFFTFYLHAQNIEFNDDFFKNDTKGLKQAIKNIKEGNMYFDMNKKGAYLHALPPYMEAYKINPNNALLNYKIGICYLYSSEKTKAFDYFKRAIELDPNVAPDVKFLFGQSCQLNYQFDDAIKQFKEYKKDASTDNVGKLSSDIDKKIKECENGKKLIKDTIHINVDGDTIRTFIQNLGCTVNSIFPDYNPIINADESVMYFVSQRDNTTGGELSPEDLNYYEDIYKTTKTDSINWAAPVSVGRPLNSIENDAVVGLSPDGQKLFSYKGDNGGDIYVSTLHGKEWSKPEKLNENINSSFKESSASLSPDGRSLYFVSNRPGGQGGSDIYVSKMNAKGIWEKAKNLGSVINTSYDEEGVFMHPDGKTLYFSSKGHNSMGGYDIFKSVFENGKWSEPENIGYPVNTPDDDVFFSIAANGMHGYFSSIRADGCGERDLYRVTFKAKPPQLVLLKGNVLDDKTKKPIEADIVIVDNQSNQEISTFKSNSETGKYLISLPSGHDYGITVKADNYLFHSENINFPKTYSYKEINKDILLKSISVGNKIVLNNIFFDFGKATLRPESKMELDRLIKMLTDIPTLKIEISGHTDNVGTQEANVKLSRERAKSVVDYLIENHISKDRLKFEGYGFSQPIAPNDTEENKQLNRRTEFKVLSK